MVACGLFFFFDVSEFEVLLFHIEKKNIAKVMTSIVYLNPVQDTKIPGGYWME